MSKKKHFVQVLKEKIEVMAKKIFMHVVKLQHSSVAFYVENSRKKKKKK